MWAELGQALEFGNHFSKHCNPEKQYSKESSV